MKPLSDAIIGLYDWHADRYIEDRACVRWDERPWLDRFIALLPKNGSVLDLGCGCGEPVARYLINHGLAVEGADSAATLISHCRGNFRNGPGALLICARSSSIGSSRAYWHGTVVFSLPIVINGTCSPHSRSTRPAAPRWCLPAARHTAKPSAHMEESLSITPVWRLRSTWCFSTVTDFVSRRMSLKTPIAVVTQYGLRAAT